MTSINALRFNRDQGLMICDETRSWNEEDMMINAADKIRPVIPEEVTDAVGIVGAYGNTGTSTIGDELRLGIRRRVAARYREHLKAHRKPPRFTCEEIAAIVWEAMAAMKEAHTSQYLHGKLGFRQHDLVRGFYLKDGKKVEIRDKGAVERALEAVTWEKKSAEVKPVFANGGIFAGWDPAQGFRIFQYSLSEKYYEPVDACFVAGGSASDTTNRTLATFAAARDYAERSGDIDPALGTLTFLAALGEACRTNIGVGGYYNILFFDGRRKPRERLREVNDHRSKLASEIANAWRVDLIPHEAGRALIDALLFKGEPIAKVHARFFGSTGNPALLDRYLRGYRVVEKGV